MTRNDCLRRWRKKQLLNGCCIRCSRKALPNIRHCKIHIRKKERGLLKMKAKDEKQVRRELASAGIRPEAIDKEIGELKNQEEEEEVFI